MSLIAVLLAGVGVGVAYGVFGGGGSAFATPVLALLGVPPIIAVASPLPAMLPASILGAREYLRAGMLDRRVALLAIAAGVPAVVAGATGSRVVGGEGLLVLSGMVLAGVGIRMLVPTAHTEQARTRCDDRCDRTAVVIGFAAAAGFVAGLLANGGGLLLVPLFVIGFGFSPARAAGTSLVAAAALAVPTTAAHWLLGDIDWAVAGAFAVGLVPAAPVGARLGLRVPDRVTLPVFGCVLVAFSLWFLLSLAR